MSELLGLEDRDTSVPPYDSLAEAACLNWLIMEPQHIPQSDLTPLLVFPEHQAIYKAMQRVYREGEQWPRFYVRLLSEVQRVSPGVLRVLDGLPDSEFNW